MLVDIVFYALYFTLGSAVPRTGMCRWIPAFFRTAMPVQVFSGRAGAAQHGTLPGNGGLPDGRKLVSGSAVLKGLRKSVFGKFRLPSFFQRRLYLRASQVCADEITWKCTAIIGFVLDRV